MTQNPRKTVQRIVGKTEHGAYVFVDDIFVHSDGLFGVTGDKAVPVSEDEFERRVDEWKDPEWSPLHHMYVEQVQNGLDQSWSEWIERQEHDIYHSVIDSAPGWIFDEVMERENGEPYDVEHIGCGRIFGGDHSPDFAEVYDEALLNLVQGIESGDMSADDVRQLIE